MGILFPSLASARSVRTPTLKVIVNFDDEALARLKALKQGVVVGTIHEADLKDGGDPQTIILDRTASVKAENGAVATFASEEIGPALGKRGQYVGVTINTYSDRSNGQTNNLLSCTDPALDFGKSERKNNYVLNVQCKLLDLSPENVLINS
ncbi:MAG: hypothetical protein V1798_11830 [Pseudomonadota bacterium]